MDEVLKVSIAVTVASIAAAGLLSYVLGRVITQPSEHWRRAIARLFGWSAASLVVGITTSASQSVVFRSGVTRPLPVFEHSDAFTQVTIVGDVLTGASTESVTTGAAGWVGYDDRIAA